MTFSPNRQSTRAPGHTVGIIIQREVGSRALINQQSSSRTDGPLVGVHFMMVVTQNIPQQRCNRKRVTAICIAGKETRSCSATRLCALLAMPFWQGVVGSHYNIAAGHIWTCFAPVPKCEKKEQRRLAPWLYMRSAGERVSNTHIFRHVPENFGLVCVRYGTDCAVYIRKRNTFGN